MKKTILFILLAFFGCTDTEEDALENFKKGDVFFVKREFEVAEYYFERIPEESPLYRRARKRLDSIAVVKKYWVEKEVPAQDVPKIQILNHSYANDNVRHVPAHALELYNNLDRNIEYIEVEFTYVDERGLVIGTLTTEVHISLYPNSRGKFSGIEPGYVGKNFVSSNAKIVKARFQ